MKRKCSTPKTVPKPPIQLPPRNSKRLGTATNLGGTKSWLRTTSRCNTTRDEQLQWPQLHHTHDPYDEYISTNTRYRIVDVCTSRLISSSNTNKIPTKFASIPSEIEIPHRFYTIPLRLTGNASPALVTYRLNYSNKGIWDGYQRTKYECTTLDPFDVKGKKSMIFTSLVKFGQVFLAVSLQGALVVMQEIDGCSNLTITAISWSRAVPWVSCRAFKEYLFEWDGEIMLVFLIHRNSVRVVDEVEVFRLRFPDLKWVKVEGLQGIALFLKQGGGVEVVKSSENGSCRGDWVYFNQGSDNGWWMYDMGSGCILPAY